MSGDTRKLYGPPGRAGASRYDPYASIDAMAWGTQHLGWTRWPNSSRRC